MCLVWLQGVQVVQFVTREVFRPHQSFKLYEWSCHAWFPHGSGYISVRQEWHTGTSEEGALFRESLTTAVYINTVSTTSESNTNSIYTQLIPSIKGLQFPVKAQSSGPFPALLGNAEDNSTKKKVSHFLNFFGLLA